MYTQVDQRIQRLGDAAPVESLLAERRVGLEREALRVIADGTISQSDHPRALGAALANPYITTDFSEALLEVVTPPMTRASEALRWLGGVHRYVAERLEDDERLWPSSMPCILHGDDSIRVGEYGESLNGRMKRIYRLGLAARYGRRMQAIAGIHFNFSMPESSWEQWQNLHEGVEPSPPYQADRDCNMSAQQARITAGYFHMTRNLMRLGWVVPYLFGASPAICRTFLDEGQGADLASLGDNTFYAPDGTSLRMGNIGYRYRKDHGVDMHVRHDSFRHWLADVRRLVTTEHPAWRELGLRDSNGQRLQLNANHLQIENEYYSSVRPKQITEAGEMPLLAMERRGIRYLELRSLDVDPYSPCGLSLPQLHFLELLMVFAWLDDSPPLLDQELACSRENVERVAHDGRHPSLQLECAKGRRIALRDWGEELLQRLEPLAAALDSVRPDNAYSTAVQIAASRFADPDQTPSARVLADIRTAGSFFTFNDEQAEKMNEAMLALPLDDEVEQALDNAVEASFAKADELVRQSEGVDFELWLDEYFSQLQPRESEPA